MTKEQLMNYKEFGEHTDFVKKADELNTGGDLYCYDKRGIRTTDINDCLDMIEWKGDVGYLEGCIVIEVHHIYGYVDTIEVPCEICVEGWDEEEKVFDTESYTIKDVEEW